MLATLHRLFALRIALPPLPCDELLFISAQQHREALCLTSRTKCRGEYLHVMTTFGGQL